MKYAHIVSYVMDTPWAILRSKLEEIEAILEYHVAGGKFTAEEMQARIGEPSRPQPGRNGAIAVLPLQGVIAHRMGGMDEMSGGTSTERFAGMFRQALADESVGAIVIDVNSPGGTVAGVTELAAEIYAARGQKPIIAQVNAMAASAAYWIASAADEVVSTPSGTVGAIGIITAHVDTSKAEEAEGVTRTVVSAGKYKAEGHGPMTEEGLAALQSRVNEFYGLMTKDIGRGRGVSASAVRDGFGEGRVVTAAQGKALGMVDRIATMDETLARLSSPQGRARVGMKAEGIDEIHVHDSPALVEALAAVVPPDTDADRARKLGY